MNSNINRLLKNYKNARQSWESWCFMVNFNLETPNPEIRHRIDTNPLLYHLRYLAMKDYYIEFAKVLKDSNNNHDNLFILLRELALSKPEVKSKVDYHLNDLSTHEEIFTRICNLRDKFYAHLDKDYEKHIDAVPVGNLLKSFEAIEKALITLSSEEILNQYLTDVISRNEMKI